MIWHISFDPTELEPGSATKEVYRSYQLSYGINVFYKYIYSYKITWKKIL